MKKIIPYILSLFCIFSIGVLTACKQPEVSIGLVNKYLEVSIGDQIDLNAKLKLENITAEEITLTSLDDSIISISNGIATAVKEGTTFIEASYLEKTAHMEVKVVGNPTTSDVPRGLTYNAENGYISWNTVILKIDNQVVQVNSYTVYIKQGNNVTERVVVGDTKLELTEVGTFEIKVKCDEYKTNNKVIYHGSDYSEPITLTKLAKPYNLQYNDETNTLSWEADDSVSKFKVNINGVLSEEITEKQIQLDFSNKEVYKQDSFTVSVISVDSNNVEDEILVENESDKKVWTRLYAPQLSIVNGIVRWENTQQGRFHYEITRTDVNGYSTTQTVTNSEYNLNGIAGGQYTITLRAISDNQQYLSSENESQLTEIVKLEKSTLMFNHTTKTLSVDNYQNKLIKLHITYKNNTQIITMPENGSYVWDKTEDGAYSVVAYSYAQTDKELNSDVSNTINLLQLPKVDTSTLTQTLIDNNYSITFEQDQNTTYNLSYTFNGNEQALIKQQDDTYGDVDVLFKDQGNYTITITATQPNPDAQTYVLPSKTYLTVVRQADLQPTYNKNSKNISWNAIATANNYLYYINKNKSLFATDTLTETSISLNGLEFGNYSFYTKALGGIINKVLYLDSLNYAQIDFEVYHNLATPEISFNRETNIVTINKVKNASYYDVKFNSLNLIIDDSAEDVILIDLTGKLEEASTYTIDVIAKNPDNVLVNDSSVSSVSITRFSAPQKFSISADGVINIKDYPNTLYLDTNKEELLINDQETKTLDDSSLYTIKAKFVARTTELNNNYYLDSDYSTFNITRLQKPAKPVLNETVLSWQEVEFDNFAYKLNIVQDAKTKQINLNTNSVDVFSSYFSGFDLSKDFTVKVSYVYLGEDVDLSKNPSLYFTSEYSDNTTVHKIASDISMWAKEENGVTTVSWEDAEIEDVTYELSLNSSVIYTGQNTSLDITSYCADEKQYTLKLKISKAGYLSSEYVVIYIERLQNPNQITIKEDETIVINTKYKDDTYQFVETQNGYEIQQLVQLEKIEVTCGQDTDVTSLASYTGEFEVSVKLIAKQYTSGKYYYLNSNTSIFTFKRISTLSAPEINDNQITWDLIDGVSKYQFKFSSGEQNLYLERSSTQTLSILDADVKNIITKLNSTTFNVSVIAKIGQFTIKNGESSNLSSRYSSSSDIIKLEPVSNIVIQNLDDSDYKQQSVKISWDYSFIDVQVKNFVVEVYKSNKLFATHIVEGTNNYIVLNDLTASGEYYAKIGVVGTSNFINSDTITSNKITRLNAVSGVSISQQALLTFKGIDKAEKYIVTYSDGLNIKGEKETTSTSLDFSQEFINQTFFGQVIINVYAIGDGGKGENNTLTSNASSNLTLTKPNQGIITLYSNKLVAGDKNSDDVDANCVYVITILQDQRIVKTMELAYGSEYVFEDFVYQDTKEKVPTDVAKEYDFVVRRKVNKSNYIPSDPTTVSATKLPQIQNAGFIRENQDVNSIINFRADIVENASQYVLTINNKNVINSFKITSQYLSLGLSAEIYKLFTASWSIKIYAQGQISENSTSYLDSSITTLSGKKLSTVSNFKVSNGVLVWSKNASATDYAIRVTDTETLTGYVVDGVHNLSEDLKGKSGEFSLNIKAVGNVFTTLVTSDIILDSTYILDTTKTDIVEKDYKCKKLAMVDDLKVLNGFITFKQLQEENVYYKAVIDGTYYNLGLQALDEVDYFRAYSQEMYNDLMVNTIYELGMKVITSQADILYSDICNPIKLKIKSNNATGSLKVQLSVQDGKINYTQANLVWDEDENVGKEGYWVQIEGEYVALVTEAKYLLDANDQVLSGSTFYARIMVAGNSELDSDGAYALNSKQSELIYITKLEIPTPSLMAGKLTWTSVENALGYLVYLDGECVSGDTPLNTTVLELDKATDSNISYSRYQVKAVPQQNTLFIASTFGLYQDPETKDALEVIKLGAPDLFEINKGALVWNVSQQSELDKLLSGTMESPFTASKDSLLNGEDLFKMLLVDANHNTYEYTENAIKYMKLSDDAKDYLQTLLTLTDDEIQKFEYNGWPSLDNHFYELAGDIPAGEYSLYTLQHGDDEKYLTSNYGAQKLVYIPYAPANLEIKFSENNFILNWDEVTFEQKYASNPVKYIVFAEYIEQVDGVNTTKRIILTEETGISETSLNLTTLIENEIIDSSYKAFGVYVAGNNQNILNGKPTEKIGVTILDKTSAHVHNGEVYWNAQDSATEYLIKYTEYNNPTSTKSITVKEAHWTAEELSSLITNYDVTIQAIGIKKSSKTHTVLSGKTSNIGKITKLTTPTAIVDDGVFIWTHIENSTSYKVHISGEVEVVKDLPISINEDGYLCYETTYNNKDLLYKFQAIGDIDKTLDETTLAYVNSNKGSDTYGTTVDQVTNVVAINGELVWDIVTNNSIALNYYKLIFNKVDAHGNLTNSEIIIKNNGFKTAESICSYSCESLDKGRYQVTIQAYYDSSNLLKTYQYEETVAYYLMGLKSEVYVFEKYDTVKGFKESGEIDNLVIQDGKFTWEYAGELDINNYEYELKFTSKEGAIDPIRTENNYFEGYIVEKLINTSAFELEIRVVPKEGVTDYVNSDYKKFYNIENENSPLVYQLDGVQETDIVLGKVGESQDLHIIWETYNISTGGAITTAINVNYTVTFWTSVDETKHQLVVNTKYINTTLFELSITNEYTLYYTIQVNPLGNQSYVSSYPSNVREIQKPNSVEEVLYNTTEQCFTWATDGTSNDHNYKIKDEILKLDENGQIVLENGEPVVVRTYYFTTTNNTTNVYYPIEMGAHKISVAVVVKNSGNEGSLTSDFTYYYDKINEPNNDLIGSIVIINLFELSQTDIGVYGANGTENNPYLVSTAEQFANVAYRLSKPNYQNTYVLKQNDQETQVTLSGNNKHFCFKQTNDLVDVTPLGQGNVDEFNGVYNGNYKSITWKFALQNIPSSKDKKQFVALFAVIGANAKVENLKVLHDLSGELTIGASISLICFENKGTINNVTLGEKGKELSILSRYNASWYGVAQSNKGIISNVVNYYNLTLKNTTNSSGTRANYAGIVDVNNGTVSQCANFGDIYLQTTYTISGGIVATNHSVVQQSALKNNSVTINIAKESRGDINIKFGGVVGDNKAGSISYCYAYTNTIINRSAPTSTNEAVYIAGLIGVSNNGNITSCFVYNNITTTTTGAQIGNVYVFIANISSASNGTGEQCYYNAGQTHSAVGGTGASNFNLISSYATVPSGSAMNKGNAYYTTNEIEFPKLRWENEFIQNWENN